MNLTLDQFLGGILGLATGDALGAPHEGGPVERLVWRLIGRTRDGCRRWTDDTQMAIDLAESLLEHKGLMPDALSTRFAASYRWSRGYGPGAARVLKRIRKGESWRTATTAVYSEGSFGNGAAMRAPVVALFFAGSRDHVLKAAETQARVTHAHPLGVEGAVLIALAAHALLERRSPCQVLDDVAHASSRPELVGRLKTVRNWMSNDSQPSARAVASQIGSGVRADASCPSALHIALRHLEKPFDEMMQFVIQCGGDVDTIGAMSGSLWGIANGAAGLPAVNLEARDELTALATRVFQWNASQALPSR